MAKGCVVKLKGLGFGMIWDSGFTAWVQETTM